MSSHSDPEFLIPTEEENLHLASLEPTYAKYSEMTPEERQFLNSIILRTRPKKILEIGMSSGASAVIMLNALRNVPEAELHSIDLMDKYYYDETKKVGFVIDHYPDLARRCTRYSGDLAMSFIDEIGSDIDLVLIDTAHRNPGEILDTLMILPYLNDDAIIVYHDVNLHAARNRFGVSFEKSYTTNLLMSAVHGNKIIQGDWEWNDKATLPFPNIGAIRTDRTTKHHVWEVMNLLSIKWHYLPTIQQETALVPFIARHYGQYFAEYLAFTLKHQRSIAGLDIGNSIKRVIKKMIGGKGARAVVKMRSQK